MPRAASASRNNCALFDCGDERKRAGTGSRRPLLWYARRQRRQQPAVHAAEAAVAHHQDVVAGGEPLHSRGNQGVDVVEARCPRPAAPVPAPAPSPGICAAARAIAEHEVGRLQAGGRRALIVPSFIVFERGSSTARMRAPRPADAGRRAWSRWRSGDARSRRRRTPLQPCTQFEPAPDAAEALECSIAIAGATPA